MPVRTLPLVDLQKDIPRIFDQVQTSTANHQKNFVALYKLHTEAAKKTEEVKGGKKLTGEREFENVFFPLLARVLPVKKGATAADRVVKFVGAYIKFISERAAEDKDEQEQDNDDDSSDTTASRFTERLLNILLKGFQAKDKVVRYRVVFLVAEMIVHLGEVDETIYQNLRAALLDRIHDKEAMIRMQVVMALSKLAVSEDPSELSEGEQTVMQVLIDTLSTDNSAEVRRAALVNIPVTTASLPAILTRSRDTETSIRKLLYSSVLEGAARGSAHLRTLTIAQREQLVRNGLEDREKVVSTAAASLIGTWMDILGETDVKSEEELVSRLNDVDISQTDIKPQPTSEEKHQAKLSTLTAFLSMFDLHEVSTDEHGEMQRGKLASDALKSLFVTRPEILDDLYFGDAFFTDLSPEKIFLARVFIGYCVEDKEGGEQRMDSVGIPVVTNCAFRIQYYYNVLVVAEEEKQAAQDNGGLYDDEKEEFRLAQEFIVGEMLHLATHLDYGDEIGRRKMFALVRDMLVRPTLPLSLVPRCLDVMRTLSRDERDLIRVVVEIVQDLRDPGDEEDDEGAADRTQDTINPDADTSFGSDRTAAAKKSVTTRQDMSPEEQFFADKIDLRCLSLCIGLLERVNGTLDENSTLQGILNDFIIPSVRRKEQEIREQALIALGLLCLIAKNLALRTLPLFLTQAEVITTSEAARISLLQIIFDLLMAHDKSFLIPGEENTDKILNFLLKQLQEESDNTSPKILALLSIGIAKLVTCRLIPDEKAIKSLLLVYFSPYNRENQELKQCVTHFAHHYSCTSARNQRVMRDIFASVFLDVAGLYRAYNEDEEDILDISQVAGMWLDWTNPFKVMDPNGAPDDIGKAGDPLIQFELANNIIRAMLSKDIPKEDKRVLCQMLVKLYIPDEVDVDKIRTLKLLVYTLNLRRPLKDATANNAFKKFDASISKKFEKQLEGFSEEEYRQLESLKALFEYLDDVIPDDDDDNEVTTNTKKKGRKRRSDSIVSTATEEDGASVASSKRVKSKPKTKRRISTSDDDESDDDGDRTAKGTPPPPIRTMPKRSAAARKTPVIDYSFDDEIEDDDDSDHTPAARRGQTQRVRHEEEAEIDAEIDDILDDKPIGASNDSIMDDSDEEEDEVNQSLLAED